MTASPPAIRLRHTLLIADPSERRLLLTPAGRLPTVELPAHPWQRIDGLVDAARAAFGLDLRVLRAVALGTAPDPGTERWPSAYLCALREVGTVLPDGWGWSARREFEAGAGLLDAPPNQAPPLAAPPERIVPAALASWRWGSRVPWYALPFAVAAEAWGSARLRERGLDPSPAQQLRSWERAALWRYDVDGRPAAYLKAVHAPFAAEVPLSAVLAAQGAPVAAPLAVDVERGLLLLEAVPGAPLAERPDPALWQRALASYAELQIAAAWRSDALLATGVSHRPLDELRRGLQLLPDSPWLARAGLDASEIAALRDRLPQFDRSAAELAAWKLPDTLEHGDLWPAQVLVPDGATREGAPEWGGAVFLDWSDASLAQPLFSLWFFLVEHATDLPGVPRARLEQAYLDPWEREAGRSLAEPLRLATQLAPLHHALHYTERILPAMAHPDEAVRMPAWFVRSALLME